MSEPLPPTEDFKPWEQHGRPRLGEDAFYGLAGEIVRAIEPHTEADEGGILLTLLASFGCAVGSGPYMQPGSGRHPPRLNVLLVGETARSRKGTSWSDASLILSLADSHWYGERIMGGLASGEGLIASVRDGGGGEGDRGVDDKRLFVFEPEFARVLAVGTREGNTLSTIIRQAWDDGRLRVMTRRDPLRATGAHISILGHITRDELLRKLSTTDAANGFANRFLFALVHRSKLLPNGGGPPTDTVRAFASRFGRALNAARRIKRMHHSPEGGALWGELYRELAREPSGIVGAITARADAQVLRLSSVYALLDGSSEVAVPHLTAAWAVWRYCEASVATIFSDEAVTGDPLADEIYRLVKDQEALEEAPIALRDLHRLLGGHLSSRSLAEAITTLRRSRPPVVEVLKERSGGRPREVLKLLPSTNGHRPRSRKREQRSP